MSDDDEIEITSGIGPYARRQARRTEPPPRDIQLAEQIRELAAVVIKNHATGTADKSAKACLVLACGELYNLALKQAEKNSK